ncbi:hypothetical protein ABZ192_28230 [Streptomyces sp. NPDC006235]|uniref:hypothetical protein n=1 Tax=Streptomyces sp. NPDC006235 TaxID=3156736 RepID=UPI0033BD7802
MAPPTPTALYEDQPLQRRFRDSNAITAHIQVSPATWETTGRILLGRSGKRARGERAGEGFGRRREEAGHGVEQVAGQPPYASGVLHQRVARKVEAWTTTALRPDK